MRAGTAAALVGGGLALGVGGLALARHRRRRPVEHVEESGWNDAELPPPPDAEEDPTDPCFIDPDPSRRKLPADASVGLEGADPTGCGSPSDVEPMPVLGVPWAVGDPTPRWPVVTRNPRRWQVSYVDVRGKYHGTWGNVFGAERQNSETGERRFHVAVDIAADVGDRVRAMESGRIVAIQTFTKGTWAILEETDSGIVILYGELAPDTWNVKVGQRVTAGEPIARIGLMGTKHMLHLEAYKAGTRSNVSWYETKPGKMKPWYHFGPKPPPALLNPTRMLVLASILEKNRAKSKA
jgi:murein DD-endopeptidase MepM/ murein hydrolase activator NlpD